MATLFTIEDAEREIRANTNRVNFTYVWYGISPPNLSNYHSRMVFGPCHQTMRDLVHPIRVRLVVGAPGDDTPSGLAYAKRIYAEAFLGKNIAIDIFWWRDLIDAYFTRVNVFHNEWDRSYLTELELLKSHLTRPLYQEGMPPKHITATMTGKDILAISIRILFGGFTADSTVVPYLSLIEGGTKGIVCNLSQTNQNLSNYISNKLLDIHRQHRPAGVAWNMSGFFLRQCDGNLWWGKNFKVPHSPISSNVILGGPKKWYASKLFGLIKSRKGQDIIPMRPEFDALDLVDVFFNYSPPQQYSGLVALSLYRQILEHVLGSGRGELLEDYNMVRGTAELCAAHTEVAYQTLNMSEQNLTGIQTTFTDLGALRLGDGQQYLDALNIAGSRIILTNESFGSSVEFAHSAGSSIHDEPWKYTPDDGVLFIESCSLVKILSGAWSRKSSRTISPPRSRA